MFDVGRSSFGFVIHESDLRRYTIRMCENRKRTDEFPKKVKVNAYSGYKANERPLSFVMDRKTIEVLEIIDRWYGVESDYFKILGQDGMLYILKWHRLLDVWLVVKRMQD